MRKVLYPFNLVIDQTGALNNLLEGVHLFVGGHLLESGLFNEIHNCNYSVSGFSSQKETHILFVSTWWIPSSPRDKANSTARWALLSVVLYEAKQNTSLHCIYLHHGFHTRRKQKIPDFSLSRKQFSLTITLIKWKVVNLYLNLLKIISTDTLNQNLQQPSNKIPWL